MQLIKEKASHWYQIKDGICVPCHEWPRADGKGMKATTLREAKLFRLLCSVTNVLDGVIAKPELINWRITQGIMAALTLPKIAGESEDAFAERVVEDMNAYPSEAADFGTQCHDHIAEYITNGEVLLTEPEPFTRSAREWVSQNVTKIHGAEMTVFHPELCIAGRLDLDCDTRRYGRTIIDFKSQKVRKQKDGTWKPTFYDEYPVQLAAYGDCVRRSMAQVSGSLETGYEYLHTEMPTLISIIINSVEPTECFVQVYENGEYYLRLFKHALDWWCYKKGYDPRTGAAPNLGISDGTNTVRLLTQSIEVEEMKAQCKGMEKAT